ncbi:MAG TPA: AraC family transcriptional regulator [Pseudomonas sabulinigri]|uniref:HTH araC/xylS-type domain-containing protein n=1 Tax=marine sediment metagenome TaxID=412755 RepID=A0A0F9UQX3_9ZZZZ|nr:AraC family transcriptional regulator [Halopseudomonas sabulinigri]HEC50801.1 AraC family transcriptional regulator [Halopseudomonas sabulinigri]|tara:strand:- start:20110 stop:21150 length:1041 start_codon:yes stop_codon:yes gene_type:complete
MEHAERTTSAGWARAIAQALEGRGVNAAELFAELGIETEVLTDPDGRIPQDSMTRLWRRAVEVSGNPAIGLSMAQTLRPGHFSVVGYAMMSSRNLLEGFGRVVRYQRILGESADLVLSVEPGFYRISFAIHGDRLPAPFQSHDAAMAYALAFCRWMTAQPIRPLRATFSIPEPADSTAYAELFDCPLEFSADCYSLHLSRDIMETPLASANDMLAQLHDRFAGDYLARFESDPVTHQARQVLCRLLPQGEPKRQAVANAMKVSTRTLQRRLQEEGISFQQLLEKTRRELALQYLGQPQLTLFEIACMLGFADPSNFFRAFKRWFGLPPGQYREQVLQNEQQRPSEE